MRAAVAAAAVRELVYIGPAALDDVLREQFEFLMDEGAQAKPSKRAVARLAEVSAILLDPFPGDATRKRA
jgi:hypothetical protein